MNMNAKTQAEQNQISMDIANLIVLKKANDEAFTASYKSKKAGIETRENMLDITRRGRELARKIARATKKQIKLFANATGYTDVEPYEVVKIISSQTVEVRPMDAVLDPDWKPEMYVGGFAAHTSNNYSQKYTYESMPEAAPIRIRWSKANSCWQASKYRPFRMSDNPHKFHDYNF